MPKTTIDDDVDLRSRAEEIRARRMVDDAKHWRSRAEELRTQSELMGDSIARGTMLDTAESYETLANRIEERLRQLKKPSKRRHLKPTPITE